MTTDPKSVLVTGAGGAVGPLLVRKLTEGGYRVRALVHDRPHAKFPEGVEVVAGDLRDREVAGTAVAGVDRIFHFAAKLHINQPSDSLKKEYEETNVDATRSLLELSECRRFIFASTINVYGPGGAFDEQSPENPDGIYAETKLAAEKLVLKHEGGTVLRFAAIYGKRMKGNFPRLVEALRQGRFAYVGAGTNRRTLIFDSDAVRSAVLCSEREAAAGRIYNVTDGEVHTLKETVDAICSALGRKPPRIKIPEPFARMAFAGADTLLRISGSERRFTPLIDKINEDVAVSGDRIRNELGFRAEYGLLDGWTEALTRK